MIPPIKTGQNRQCIDNITDYDREHNRIFKSVRHRLDLGPNMLPGAQQYTTVESAAALKIKDKIEDKYDEDMHNINGQYRNEMYKRAENMIPQLDGTFNVSDDSDSDSQLLRLGRHKYYCVQNAREKQQSSLEFLLIN